MSLMDLILTHRWELAAMVVLLIYGKSLYRVYVFDPIAGGNGKVQMDEIAKTVLLYIAIRAERAEAQGPEQIYPEMFWVSVLGSIALIAGLKHHYKYVSDHKKSDTGSHSGNPVGSSGNAVVTGKNEEAG